MPGVETPDLAARLNLRLSRLVLILAGVFLAIGLGRPLLDNVDLGWHVAQGRWMATHGAVYRHDLMNYPNLGKPLVDEYPLFQVALYEAASWGDVALVLLAASIYAGLAVFLLRAARDFFPGGSALLGLTLALMLLYFQLAFPLRPHLVTYAGVGVMGVWLLRHREAASWRVFGPMAALQVVWVNCHSGFVLGPLMAAAFGVETSLRHSFHQRRVAWPTLRAWAGGCFFLLLACLVNPFGWQRFRPVFYQGQAFEIRAYVGEMQPLTGIVASLTLGMALVGFLAITLAAARARESISYSFLLLAGLLFGESLEVMKSWPVFGIFLPLLVLSTRAFSGVRDPVSAPAWSRFAGHLFVAVALVMAIDVRLTGDSLVSIPGVWHEYRLGRRELPYQAVDWMRRMHVEGRLLNRSEVGGLLQQSGYDHGETFGDTGFGKYDQRAIRLLSMLGDRPALLPAYLEAFQPSFVLCNTLCYRLPYQLLHAGWRMIFYSLSGTVWTQAHTRTDLPSISGEQAAVALARDIREHGRPANPVLYGNALLALHAAGQEDFAFDQLNALPADDHHARWYWAAAHVMCFETPRCSEKHRDSFVAEAERLHEESLTEEFQARGQVEEVNSFDTSTDENITPAPERAAVGDELRDGAYWAAEALANEHAGRIEPAAREWKQAVFFAPDDMAIVAGARSFAAQQHNARLNQEITELVNFLPTQKRGL